MIPIMSSKEDISILKVCIQKEYMLEYLENHTSSSLESHI